MTERDPVVVVARDELSGAALTGAEVDEPEDDRAVPPALEDDAASEPEDPVELVPAPDPDEDPAEPVPAPEPEEPVALVPAPEPGDPVELVPALEPDEDPVEPVPAPEADHADDPAEPPPELELPLVLDAAPDAPVPSWASAP